MMENKSEIGTKTSKKPIIYLGAVMDEEARPLLKNALPTLEDDEGYLVVFRKKDGENMNQIFESNVELINNHGWNYISHGKNNSENDPMQMLVDQLYEQANQLRCPVVLFSQGDAKIKADDETRIYFGLVGKNPGKITTIVGIIHQQLNMGLNGDLILHEAEIILQSLFDKGVFNDANGEPRPIQIKTYGAGGSSNELVTPGKLIVSDAVIDIRTHVDPAFTIQYLYDYCSEHNRKNPNEDHNKYKRLVSKYNELNQEILSPDFSGMQMVHQVSAFARLVSEYTGKTVNEVVKNFPLDQKVYYGEISYGTPMDGCSPIHRIMHDENGSRFIGIEGQKMAMKLTTQFFKDMSNYSEKTKEQPIHEENEFNAINFFRNPKKIQLEEIKEAHYLLKKQINKTQERHEEIHGKIQFNITTAGNLFFTEKDKAAAAEYDSQLVEMENYLFVQIINWCVSHNLYVVDELITKIASDPLTINKVLNDELNKWAATSSMTLNDYVEAFIWAKNGQHTTAVPESGRWHYVEEMLKTHPEFDGKFYSMSQSDYKIMNPFWKEIGTDFIPEIIDGKAFMGDAFQHLSLTEEPLKTKVEELKAEARELQNLSYANPDIEATAKNVFHKYMQIMSPMQISGDGIDDQYRVYARKTGLLPKGFVTDNVTDWDQSIYKSTNTVVLDQLASLIIDCEDQSYHPGKKVVTDHSIMEHPNYKSDHIHQEENVNQNLKKVIKILRECAKRSDDVTMPLCKEFIDNFNKILGHKSLVHEDTIGFIYSEFMSCLNIQTSKIINLTEESAKDPEDKSLLLACKQFLLHVDRILRMKYSLLVFFPDQQVDMEKYIDETSHRIVDIILSEANPPQIQRGSTTDLPTNSSAVSRVHSSPPLGRK